MGRGVEENTDKLIDLLKCHKQIPYWIHVRCMYQAANISHWLNGEMQLELPNIEPHYSLWFEHCSIFWTLHYCLSLSDWWLLIIPLRYFTIYIYVYIQWKAKSRNNSKIWQKNRKNRDKIDTPNTHIHEHIVSNLGAFISIKRGELNGALWTQLPF